jgi:hypothetical protein
MRTKNRRNPLPTRPAAALEAPPVAATPTMTGAEREARLLVDPYFPKHHPISDQLRIDLRRFYDFAVRNGEWLRSYNLTTQERKIWAEGEMNPDWIRLDKTVECVARRRPDGLCLTLFNLNGIENPCWNIAHPFPIQFIELPAMIEYHRKPHKVLWSCPEQTTSPEALSFEYERHELHFTIPHLCNLGLVYIHD